MFRLIRDHHIQKGPSFPKLIDVLIDATTGHVTSPSPDGKVSQDHLRLPADVSNGLPPNLLMNIVPSAKEPRISFVAPTKKPRLIHLSIRNAGEAPFSVGDTHRKAIDYVVHVEVGGIAGAIAPLVGKQPLDFHIWILGGTAPAFIREEGQLYEGGPVWRIEQISPTFSKRGLYVGQNCREKLVPTSFSMAEAVAACELCPLEPRPPYMRDTFERQAGKGSHDPQFHSALQGEVRDGWSPANFRPAFAFRICAVVSVLLSYASSSWCAISP